MDGQFLVLRGVMRSLGSGQVWDWDSRVRWDGKGAVSGGGGGGEVEEVSFVLLVLCRVMARLWRSRVVD